jgi:hypothetical protein
MTLPEVRPAAAVTDEPEHPGSSREPFLRLLTQVMESGHVSDNFRIAITAPREITFTFKGTAVFSRAWFEPLHLLLSSQGSPPPSRGRRLHLQGDSDFTFKGTATSPSRGRRLHLKGTATSPQGDSDFTFKGTATSPSRGRRLHLQGDGDFVFRETATSSSRGRRLHLQGSGDFTFRGRRLHLQGAADFSCAWFGLRFKGAAVCGCTWFWAPTPSPARPKGRPHLQGQPEDAFSFRGNQVIAFTFKGDQGASFRVPGGQRSAAAPSPSPARPGVAFNFKGAAVSSRTWFRPLH